MELTKTIKQLGLRINLNKLLQNFPSVANSAGKRGMLIIFIIGSVIAGCAGDTVSKMSSRMDPEANAATGFVSQANLPANAKQTCTADISPWFGGSVTANGTVKPANGLDPIFANFKDNTRCDFYKWGAQMFLWLTSGTDTQHVFNTSPGFYNVSVAEDGHRSFLPGNGPMLLAVRKEKTDTEIELGQAGGGDVLLSQKESLVYYGMHTNDVYALYTTAQKTGVLALEDDAVCVAQYKKCAVEIAGYCKKQLASCIKKSKNIAFPSTAAQIEEVAKFAAAYGYPLSNKQAMAMELKTSWIDAATLSASDQQNYVLAKAVVPVFDRAGMDAAGAQQWTVVDNKEKTLALVGMHVVGTVNGHPEMVWSTFEHVNNVPDNTYTYTTVSNTTATQSYDSSGVWNFLPSNAAAPTSITSNGLVSTYPPATNSNPEPACKKASKINAPECIVNVTDGTAIAPINVFRVDPWGDDQSSPSSVVANNTDLVSINVSVLSQLKAGDIRGNYIQTGGIWTSKGQIPSDGNDTDLRGSLNLANTTMETFYQFYNSASGAFNPKNCFGCHGSTPTDATAISHIFDDLQPLPKK